MGSTLSTAADTADSPGRSTILNDTARHLTLSQALPLITRLDQTGVNLSEWERQLKLAIPQVTGLGPDYLDAPSSTAADPDTDQIVLSMIILSVAEPLRNLAHTSGTAREALRQLKYVFGPATQYDALAADHSTAPRSHDVPSAISNQIECLDDGIRWLHKLRMNLLITEKTSSKQSTACPASSTSRSLATVSQAQRIPMFTSSTFPNMPCEILERIIDYVNILVRDEVRSIQYAKQLKDVSRELSTGEEYYVYEATDVPKFNSLQSLACVDRKMYRLCCRQLWKHLRFPSSAASPVSRWTSDILFKHGDLVESVSIKLESDWWEDSDSYKKELDNLKIMKPSSFKYHQGLSYKNSVKIMSKCPNVRSMKFDGYYPNQRIHTAEFHLLYERLEIIVSRFPALRHLALSFSFNAKASDALVTSIIKNLPLLESLECSNLTRAATDEPTDTLAWHLTQLKHLSKLNLASCDAMDETWCLEIWPQTIKCLSLFGCKNLSINAVQQLIPRMAPNLIDMVLSLRSRGQQNAENHTLVAQHQFNLPALRSLRIFKASIHLSLLNFQQCKNLRRVWSWKMPSDVWMLVPRLICASTWPQLELLDVQSAEMDDDTDWNFHVDLFRMRKFCDENGTGLLYEPENF